MNKHPFHLWGLFLCALVTFSPLASWGQSDTIRGHINHDAEYLIREVFLAGDCFEVFNITLDGQVGQAGTFNDGMASIGIDSGVVLSNGRVEDISGPNDTLDLGFSYNVSGNDPDLDTLTSRDNTGTLDQFDRVALEFDFIPTVENASFEFVFASEEYCRYIFNTWEDVFGFFVSGPGINGPFQDRAINVALTPVTERPITVKTINSFIPETSPYYVNNIEPGQEFCSLSEPAAAPGLIQFNGYTTPLRASFEVIPCQTYHLKLVLADRGSDSFWDSAIFLAANSFAAGLTSRISSTVQGPQIGENAGLEGCGKAELIFSRGDSIIANDLVVRYDILPTSTATEGVDFSEIPDSIIIPAGIYADTVIVDLFPDNFAEGTEDFIIRLRNPCQCSRGTLSFSIVEPPPLTGFIDGPTELCENEPLELGVVPLTGNGAITYEWQNGDDQDSIFRDVPINTTLYEVVLTDECGQTDTIRQEVEVKKPRAFIDGQIVICDGLPLDSVPIVLSGADNFTFDILTNNTSTTTFSNITTDTFWLPVTTTSVYQVSTISGDGCMGRGDGVGSSIEVNVQADVVVDSVACADGNDGNIRLSAFGGNGNYTFLWAHDLSNITDSALNLTSGTYITTITDGQGCQEVLSTPIFEPAPLVLAIDTLKATEDCRSGGSLALNIEGGTAPYRINWSNGIETAQNDNLAADTYLVTVRDTNDCINNLVSSIDDATQLPTINIATPAELSCDQEMVDIDASGTSQRDHLTYLWTDSSGDPITTPDPLLWATSTSGLYTLVVTDTLTGCSQSEQVEVRQGTGILTVDLQANNTRIDCTPNTINLSASEANSTTVNWQWSTTDGQIDGDPNSTAVSATAPGWYYVRADALDNNCFGLDSVLITIDTIRPEATLVASNSLDCRTTSVNLEAQMNTSRNFSYIWSTLDGNITTDTDRTTIGVDAGGNYAVIITDTDNGCAQRFNTQLEDLRTDVRLTNIADQNINCITTSATLEAEATGGNNFTFAWLDVNRDTIQQSASFTISTADTYTLQALNTDNFCSDEVSFEVQVDTIAPVANIAFPDTLTCNQEELNLAGTIIAGATPTWTNTSGQVLNTTDWTLTVDQSDTYQLLATNDGNGCQDSISVSVIADKVLPTASVSVNDTLDCFTDQVSLLGSPIDQGVPYTLSWSGPVNGLVGPIDQSIAGAARPGIYQFIVENTNTGCRDSFPVEVLEDIDDLLINNIPDTSLTCLRTSVQLTGSSPSPGTLSYSWLDSDGMVISNSATANIATAGNYEFVVATSDNSCDRSITVVIADDTQPPMVSALANSQLTCEQDTVILTGVSDNTMLTYVWRNLAGDTLSRSGNTYVADAAERYELIGQDPSTGCESNLIFDVPIDTIAPQFALAAPLPLSCDNEQVTISSTITGSNGTLSYEWFDLAGNSQGMLDSLIVQDANQYTLMVTDASNGCSSSEAIEVDDITVVIEMPTLEDIILSCSEPTADLIFGHPTGSSIVWLTNNNDTISTSGNVTIGSPGDYIVVVTDQASGCTGSSEFVASLADDLPDVEAGPPVVIGCDTGTATLEGTVGPDNYTPNWFDADGNLVAANSWTLTTSQAGNYTLEVTNEDTGCSATDSAAVTVDQNAPEVMVADALIDCFTGEAIVPTSGTSTGSNINYTVLDASGNTVLTTDELNIVLNTTGEYQLIAQNSTNNCSNSMAFNIQSDAPSIANTMATDPTCTGQSGSAQITEAIGGTAPYVYAINDGTFGNESFFTGLIPGSYTLSIQDSRGCEDTANILIAEAEGVTIILPAIHELTLGESLTLEPDVNVDTSTLTSVAWTPADLLSCAKCFTPTVVTNSTTTYELTIVDANGCIEVAQTTVIVDQRVPVYIPTAFSPNTTEGTNDRFAIFADSDQVSSILNLEIYDRWGSQVYSKQNIAPNDESAGWDGTNRGRNLNAGIYVYMLTVQLSNGKVAHYQGEVLLMK